MRRYVYIMSAAVLAVLMPVSGLGAVASDSDTSSLWTLKECIDYAMENNIDLQQSHNQYLSGIEDTKQAKAALFPSLSASTSNVMSVSDTINPLIQSSDGAGVIFPSTDGSSMR